MSRTQARHLGLGIAATATLAAAGAALATPASADITGMTSSSTTYVVGQTYTLTFQVSGTSPMAVVDIASKVDGSITESMPTITNGVATVQFSPTIAGDYILEATDVNVNSPTIDPAYSATLTVLATAPVTTPPPTTTPPTTTGGTGSSASGAGSFGAGSFGS